MKEFWDQRYANETYVYGITPNAFFQQQIDLLKPGKLLLPAEGEGRNAVYAASKGWQVDAFDYSQSGQKKALQLASDQKVSINYLLDDIRSFDWPEDTYDLIGLFFVHQLPQDRVFLHQKVMQSLKPGGRLVLEAFSKKQLPMTSGGPKNIDMLFSKAMLEEDFSPYRPQLLKEESVILNEGTFHQGNAFVLRMVIVKS